MELASINEESQDMKVNGLSSDMNVILQFIYIVWSSRVHLFLDTSTHASTHLYKRVCPSIGPSVGRSVRLSVGPLVRPSVSLF